MTTSTHASTRLVMIRHGESNVTVNRIVGGHRSCNGLSDLGRQQSDRLRDRLAATGELHADVLISSNFPRAIETAERISPALGDPTIVIEPGFGEHDPGPDIDGMTFEGYVERFGTPDWTDPHVDVFPGGETISAFHTRVGSALADVLERHRGASIVVACHGGVVDATFRLLLRTASTGGFVLHTLNTSITEFSSLPSGEWRLERYNDAAHLDGLPAETPRSTVVS